VNFTIQFGLQGLQQMLGQLRTAASFGFNAVAGDTSGQSLFRSFARIAANLGPFNRFMAQLSSLFNIINVLGIGSDVAGLKIIGLAFAVRILLTVVEGAVATIHKLTADLGGVAATGGNYGAFGAVQAMLGPEGVQMSRSLRDRIASNGMAMIEAGRHGMRAFPREFGMGGAGDAALMLQEIRAIHGFRTEMEAVRHESILGTEALHKWYFATNAQINQLEAEGRIRGEVLRTMAPTAVQLDIELLKLNNRFQDLKETLGVITVGGLNSFLESLGQFWSNPFQGLANFAQNFGTMLGQLLGRLVGTSFQGIFGLNQQGGIQGALQSNTAAINQNTRALSAARKVWGGERAQRAIPAGLRNEALSHWIADGQALALGQIR
jgi:hypothetical protein